jgi:hypothetical protein
MRVNTTPIILQYGLQRSATNWVRKLIELNFENVTFGNECERHSLLHKHSLQVLQTSTFEEFDDKVYAAIGKRPMYVVCIKHPYSWFLSYRKWTWKCRTLQRDNDKAYVRLYDAFYGKWLEYAVEQPKRVHLVQYEALLQNDESFQSVMNNIQLKLTLRAVHCPFQRPRANVSQSATFNTLRERYYREQRWKDDLKERDKRLLAHKVDTLIPFYFQYEVLNEDRTEWIIPHQTSLTLLWNHD